MDQVCSSDDVRMRRFMMVRASDPSGVSGIGEVAEGIVFSSGEVVLHWLRAPSGINVYRCIEDVIQVHGHAGQTILCFIDREPTENM